MLHTCWQVGKSAAFCGWGCKKVGYNNQLVLKSLSRLWWPPVHIWLSLLGYESLRDGQVQVTTHINEREKAHLDLASGISTKDHEGYSRRQRNSTGFLISALIRAQGCGFASDIATKSRSELFFFSQMVQSATTEAWGNWVKKNQTNKNKVSILTYAVVSSWAWACCKALCLLSCEQYPRNGFRILWRLEEETDPVSIACPIAQ